MATVISNNSLESHSVNKYNFKVLPFGSKDLNSKESKEEEKESNNRAQSAQTPSSQTPQEKESRASELDASALSTSSKDSLIESLMQKTDEMSSNFIKLQMKLEAKDEEHKEALAKLKESAFSEGFEAGKKEALADEQKSLNGVIEQFAASVKKLDESAELFGSSLESLKSELIFAALDIAQEVIKVELSENSSEVAKLLSQELIKDLQGASKITLKVNPKDHTTLSEEFSTFENVEILADRALSAGGVIVMSDAGNIDAQITKRFQRVKKAALNE